MNYGLVCTIHLISTTCSLTGPATNTTTCGRIHFTVFQWLIHSEAVNNRFHQLRMKLLFVLISLTALKHTVYTYNRYTCIKTRVKISYWIGMKEPNRTRFLTKIHEVHLITI